MSYRTGPDAPSVLGRTVVDVEAAAAAGHKVLNDGLNVCYLNSGEDHAHAIVGQFA